MKRYIPNVLNAATAVDATQISINMATATDATGLSKNFSQTLFGENTAIRDSAILALLANLKAKEAKDAKTLVTETNKIAAQEITPSVSFGSH